LLVSITETSDVNFAVCWMSRAFQTKKTTIIWAKIPSSPVTGLEVGPHSDDHFHCTSASDVARFRHLMLISCGLNPISMSYYSRRQEATDIWQTGSMPWDSIPFWPSVHQKL